MQKPIPRSFAAIAVLGVSCMQSPVLRNDGPVAAEGVIVSMVGQRCVSEATADPDEGTFGEFLDLGVELQIQNNTAQPIAFRPRNVQLVLGPDTDTPVEAEDSRTVAPQGKEIVRITFQRGATKGCSQPMTLVLNNAVQIGNHPIPLKRISFVASSD